MPYTRQQLSYNRIGHMDIKSAAITAKDLFLSGHDIVTGWISRHPAWALCVFIAYLALRQ